MLPHFLFAILLLLASSRLAPAQDKTIFFDPKGDTNAIPDNTAPIPDYVPKDISKMSDEEFIDMVEHDSTMYFIERIDPGSGLVGKGESAAVSLVGSNGFGLMAHVIAAERGWLTREEAATRVLRILDTFLNKASTFRGSFWWITDSATAQTNPYGGGYDIVETGYVCAGGLVCKQYFDGDSDTEKKIREFADAIYARVEFDAYLADAKGYRRNTMAWTYDAEKQQFSDFRVVGYHEAMIIYIMALGSPTHPIPDKCWEGWTAGYEWKKVFGQEYYFCPALFTHQYTQVWMDLRDVQDKPTRDKGITYFENSKRAALSHIAYAQKNPDKMPGYGPIWGLTDCGCPLHKSGFGGHGVPPSDWDLASDDGTVAFTAAAGSIVFTPRESIDFMRHVYNKFGDKIYDSWGFRDAMNVKTGWFAVEHDPLNKGAMLCSIENHRTGLIWKLFMRNPEVKVAMKKAGFRPMQSSKIPDETKPGSKPKKPAPAKGKTGAI